MSSFNKIPMFSRKEFDGWKIRMQAHLAAQDDDMWHVITDGTMKILKANIAVAITDGALHRIEKSREEWTTEDKRKANLVNVTKDILYKTLDKKFDIKMKTGESMNEYDKRVSSIINELNALGKAYSNKEAALKVVRGLPKEWDVKTMAMRESKDLNKTREGEPSTPTVTAALSAIKLEPTGSVEKTAEQLSNDTMPLFVNKFGKFIRRNQSSFQRQYQKNNSKEEPNSCYNCDKTRHFIANCPKPKKDSQHSTEKGKNSTYFTRELISTLHDMVNEYHKLALSFEKAKAKQTDPQNNKTETDESVELLSIRREIAKQKAEMIENQSLIQQLKNEISKQTNLIQAWNKSSVTLTEMQGLKKSVTDKTGLGFNRNDETSASDTMQS
ncbi:uncharacterized protein [Primulina huaijiensis]|uniref:uncharacterized protein n=1 Tax=Primulina huaijiensis TaxID=1492673 RepID=UPI003CC74EDC